MTNNDKFICRGILRDTGKFVYGYPFKRKDGWRLLDLEHDLAYFNIIKEPDRWTGECDKNGKKVWEKDILTVWIQNYKQINNYLVDNISMVTVGFLQEDFYYSWTAVEVIGNLHFNKELLKDKNA